MRPFSVIFKHRAWKGQKTAWLVAPGSFRCQEKLLMIIVYWTWPNFLSIWYLISLSIVKSIYCNISFLLCISLCCHLVNQSTSNFKQIIHQYPKAYWKLDRIEFNTKVAIFFMKIFEFSLFWWYVYSSDCGSCAMTGFEVMR